MSYLPNRHRIVAEAIRRPSEQLLRCLN